MNSEEKKSQYGSPNKQRPFTPIQSPTPKKLFLQQYNSFTRSPKGNYENLFNESGIHELKRTGLDPDPQFLSHNVQLSCNCKKTQCLKLYCPCFANGKACNDNCRCEDCLNKQQNLNRQNIQQQQIIACNCKKTSCLKKYCICFLNGRKCGKQCKCEGCKNQEEKKSDDDEEKQQSSQQNQQLFSPPRLKKKVKIESESEKIVTRRSKRQEIKIKENPNIWSEQKTTSKKKEPLQTYEDEDELIHDKKLESGKKTANQKQQLATKRQLIKK